MSRRTWALATAFTGILAGTAHAACTMPGQPPKHFPDGSTANRAAMVAAKQKVDAYVSSARKYIDCVDTDVAARLKAIRGNDKLDQKEKAARLKPLQEENKERNQVLDQMKATASAFNAEIHRFNKQ